VLASGREAIFRAGARHGGLPGGRRRRRDIAQSRSNEMTGIQALERIAPGLPMKPGKVERCEFEYRRHGTQTLIAGFDVTIGEVVGVIGDTRTEQDFARFLDTLLSSAAANTRWDIVAGVCNRFPDPPCFGHERERLFT
jgi:hypothetical protein